MLRMTDTTRPSSLILRTAVHIEAGSLLRDSMGDFLLVHNVAPKHRGPPRPWYQYVWCMGTRPWCKWGDRPLMVWPPSPATRPFYEVVATKVPMDASVDTLRELAARHVRRHGMVDDSLENFGTIPATASEVPAKLSP